MEGFLEVTVNAQRLALLYLLRIKMHAKSLLLFLLSVAATI